jgi:hypothetical protein
VVAERVAGYAGPWEGGWSVAKHTLRSGQITLAVHCEDSLGQQAKSLLAVLMPLGGQGKGLADGVTVQFGWSVLTLRQDGSELVVCEPDFGGNPFTSVREDVSSTLTVLTQQTDVLNCLGLDGVPARFDEKVVLATGRLQEERVYLQRGTPAAGDSGWYVGSVASP